MLLYVQVLIHKNIELASLVVSSWDQETYFYNHIYIYIYWWMIKIHHYEMKSLSFKCRLPGYPPCKWPAYLCSMCWCGMPPFQDEGPEKRQRATARQSISLRSLTQDTGAVGFGEECLARSAKVRFQFGPCSVSVYVLGYWFSHPFP